MITKVIDYDNNQKVNDITIYKGAAKYVEGFKYHWRVGSKLDIHDTCFNVIDDYEGKNKLICTYCLIENETIDDYAKL